MYKYLNLNPNDKRVGDCVKRAFSCAENKDYRIVALELNRLKKETGCKNFNDNKNWKEYIKRQNYEKLSFPAEKGKPRMNGERFSEIFNKGSYILRMAGHLSACVDGVIYDTWDCSYKCVYNAWKVRD